MDQETKDLMTQLRDKVGEIDNVKQAVSQLEESIKNVPDSKTIDKKLAAVSARAWDERGSYRGIFPSEDDARAFGLYVMHQVGGNDQARQALEGEMKSVIERAWGSKAQSSNPNAAGGALVPVEYADRVQRLVEQFGTYAANAMVMPMESDTLVFQRRTKGLKVFKTGQNQQATASDMEFDTITLTADEWNVLSLYPRSLSADTAGLIGEMLAQEISLAFAEQIDRSGFVGDGTPDDLDVTGIMKRLKDINGTDDGGGLVLGSGSNGAGWSGLVEDDFHKLASKPPMFRGMSPAWYTSPEFFWRVMNPIQLGQGGTTRAEFAGEQSLQFLGRPVRMVQTMPKTEGNSQIPVLYGDLRLSSTLGRRQDLTVEESRDARFEQRQVAVLGTQRVAINNHSLGDATTPGPMVGLITPAA